MNESPRVCNTPHPHPQTSSLVPPLLHLVLRVGPSWFLARDIVPPFREEIVFRGVNSPLDFPPNTQLRSLTERKLSASGRERNHLGDNSQ